VPQLVLELVLETDDLRHAEAAEVDHRKSRPEGPDCDRCAAAAPPGRPPLDVAGAPAIQSIS
jgi:hypothetical protein